MEIMTLDHADGIVTTGNLRRNGKIFMIMLHRIHQQKPRMIHLVVVQRKNLKNEQMGLGQKSQSNHVGAKSNV